MHARIRQAAALFAILWIVMVMAEQLPSGSPPSCDWCDNSSSRNTGSFGSCDWSDGDSNCSYGSCDWSDSSEEIEKHRTSKSAAIDLSLMVVEQHSPNAGSPFTSATSSQGEESNTKKRNPNATPPKASGGSMCVRRSPRVALKKNLSLDVDTACRSIPFGKEDAGWQLFHVMELNGCADCCASKVHGLTEYDILCAHASFTSKTVVQQQQWVFDYLTNNCPNNASGEKDPREMQFIICGKIVCSTLWFEILSLSNSRFYEIRKKFLAGQSQPTQKRMRSPSAKTMQSVAWMTSYFDRVGDKRPDKHGIYLPTCLTERSIYLRMVEELSEAGSVCFSQFNKIFHLQFPNVTIPKVRTQEVGSHVTGNDLT